MIPFDSIFHILNCFLFDGSLFACVIPFTPFYVTECRLRDTTAPREEPCDWSSSFGRSTDR